MYIRHSVFVYIVCGKYLVFTKQEESQNCKVFLLLLSKKILHMFPKGWTGVKKFSLCWGNSTKAALTLPCFDVRALGKYYDGK